MPLPQNPTDRFESQYRDGFRAGSIEWPATRAVAVTPSDGSDLAFVTRAIYVGGAGNLSVDLADSGSSIVFVGVPAGTTLPIRVKRVRATSTTATSIVALD